MKRKASKSVAPASAPAASVLVVDDDDDSRALLCRHLAEQRFEALDAYDGSSALEAIQAKKPHAIVLDCAMRGISGPELIRLLVTVKSLAKIPIVVVSGSNAALDEVRAMACPAVVALLPKPYDLTTLVALLREHARAPQ